MPAPARSRISELTRHTLATRLVVYGSGFIGTLIIARALGPDGRGAYYLAITVGLLAVTAASLGIEQAQVRLWSERAAPAADFSAAATASSIGIGAAVMALSWLAYELGRDSVFRELEPSEMVVIALALPLWVHLELVRGLLVISGELKRANVGLVAGDLARTAALIALVVTAGLSVQTALLLYWLTLVVPWVVFASSRARPVRLVRPPPWRLIRRQLQLGAQFAPFFLFFFLVLRVDVLLVAHYKGASAVGIYSIATVLAEALGLATGALALAIKERQANAPVSEALETTAAAIRMNLVVAGLLGIGLAALAPLAIGPLYGDEFSGAVDAMWILIPASAALAVWRTVNVVVGRLTRPLLVPAVGFAALLASIALNVALIPPFGIVGAALASLGAYALGAALATALFLRAGHVAAGALVPGRAEVRRLVEAARRGSLRALRPFGA